MLLEFLIHAPGNHHNHAPDQKGNDKSEDVICDDDENAVADVLVELLVVHHAGSFQKIAGHQMNDARLLW